MTKEEQLELLIKILDLVIDLPSEIRIDDEFVCLDYEMSKNVCNRIDGISADLPSKCYVSSFLEGWWETLVWHNDITENVSTRKVTEYVKAYVNQILKIVNN